MLQFKKWLQALRLGFLKSHRSDQSKFYSRRKCSLLRSLCPGVQPQFPSSVTTLEPGFWKDVWQHKWPKRQEAIGPIFRAGIMRSYNCKNNISFKYTNCNKVDLGSLWKRGHQTFCSSLNTVVETIIASWRYPYLPLGTVTVVFCRRHFAHVIELQVVR